MKTFQCSHCHSLIFFNDLVCLNCQHALGFEPQSLTLLAVTPLPEQAGEDDAQAADVASRWQVAGTPAPDSRCRQDHSVSAATTPTTRPATSSLPKTIRRPTVCRAARPASLPIRPVLPADAQPEKGSSSVNRETDASLSDVAMRLMRGSEQHVRHITRDHQLAWDQGMDNTVAAVARQARVDGLTGLSHMAAAGGVIRFAQADGYTIKEGSVDAHVAANTHSQASIAELAREDALRRARSLEWNAVHRPLEMAPLARA